MSTKPVAADALAALRQQIKLRMQIMRTITALQQEVLYDRICGSWLSTQSNLTAVIRHIGQTTYRMLVFDNSLCYKRLVQDAVISPVQQSLRFANRDDPRDVNTVGYDPASEMLSLGCYGPFVAEDSIGRYQKEGIVESDFQSEANDGIEG